MESQKIKRSFFTAQKLTPKDKLDLNKLRWTERLTSPNFQVPLFITVAGGQYLITDFSSPAEFALEAEVSAFEEGLSLSLELYGAATVTLEERLALRKIALEVNAAFSYPKGFTEELALFLEALPSKHLKYLSERKVSFPTLCLLTKLDEDAAEKVLEFAAWEGLSSQRFKRLAEDARDFGQLTLDRRSEAHKKLDGLLEKVRGSAGGGVSVNTPDFHESGALEVSFRAQNIKAYREAVQGISQAALSAEIYFNGLEI